MTIMIMSSRELAYHIRKYYDLPNHKVGGNCHVILEDLNVDDDSIKHCLESCKESGDIQGQFIMENFLLLRKGAREICINISRSLSDKEVFGI